MDIQELGVITLIKAAITGENATPPSNFDLESALAIAKKHQISSMLYYGATNCGFDENLPVMQNLLMTLYRCIIVSQKQKKEVDSICRAFSENGIDHMPLKGTLLREMYPYPDMRLMSDADILIKPEQYAAIRPVMEERGFEEVVESDHELVWKKSGIVIELHKRLIPSYNKDYFAYYGDGWKLAVPVHGTPHRYAMSPENQMIYLFTHFAKHYRCGGIGLRHITDLYVYRKNTENLDEDYIGAELEKLKLYEFYVNIMATVDVWFHDAAPSEKTDLITDVIFASGVFGTNLNRKIAETLILKKETTSIENAKRQRMISMIFPSLENMKFRYAFLEKLPFLLPVAWVMRLFGIVFFKRKTAKSFYKDMKNVNSENITDYKAVLNYVGLDFNFEE